MSEGILIKKMLDSSYIGVVGLGIVWHDHWQILYLTQTHHQGLLMNPVSFHSYLESIPTYWDKIK